MKIFKKLKIKSIANKAFKKIKSIFNQNKPLESLKAKNSQIITNSNLKPSDIEATPGITKDTLRNFKKTSLSFKIKFIAGFVTGFAIGLSTIQPALAVEESFPSGPVDPWNWRSFPLLKKFFGNGNRLKVGSEDVYTTFAKEKVQEQFNSEQRRKDVLNFIGTSVTLASNPYIVGFLAGVLIALTYKRLTDPYRVRFF